MDSATFTVFPTPVGVFLSQDTAMCLVLGLPHARGGVSVVSLGFSGGAKSSPRPWGCFSLQL